MIYSKELGLTVLPEARTVASDSFNLTDALALYHRLKGTGKTSLFFESSERSIRYLTECLGHDSLTLALYFLASALARFDHHPLGWMGISLRLILAVALLTSDAWINAAAIMGAVVVIYVARKS